MLIIFIFLFSGREGQGGIHRPRFADMRKTGFIEIDLLTMHKTNGALAGFVMFVHTVVTNPGFGAVGRCEEGGVPRAEDLFFGTHFKNRLVIFLPGFFFEHIAALVFE